MAWAYGCLLALQLLSSTNQESLDWVWSIQVVVGGSGGKEWTGKTIYLNFSSIFGDFFLKFFEEEVSDYLS